VRRRNALHVVGAAVKVVFWGIMRNRDILGYYEKCGFVRFGGIWVDGMGGV
jgi:hypothetical protein